MAWLVRVFLLATSYILSKCIRNVTSIKLLDTKVFESQLRGTKLSIVNVEWEKSASKKGEINTNHYRNCLAI